MQKNQVHTHKQRIINRKEAGDYSRRRICRHPCPKYSMKQEQAVKQFLRNYLNTVKDEQTLNRILQETGMYYDADRTYIYEVQKEDNLFHNTFAWCRAGIHTGKDNLRSIPLSFLQNLRKMIHSFFTHVTVLTRQEHRWKPWVLKV